MTGPQVRSPLDLAARVLVIVALVGFLVWLIVIPLIGVDGGGWVLLGLVAVFALLLLVIDLSQRRRHRYLVRLREEQPVAYVVREPVTWETALISSDDAMVRLWRIEHKRPVATVEVARSQVRLEPAELPVSNFHQRPGLRMFAGDQVVAEFWVVHDRHGLFRRRLTGDDLDRAVRSLLEGRQPRG
jgi:hypothetical protein